VDDLPGALADLHGRGLRIAGADEEAPLTARQADLRGPLAIVVGSEGQGLGPAVRRRADTFMRIPMRGVVGSLNAAVAGSILLFEAVSQRDPTGEATPPRSAPEPVLPEPAPSAEAGEPVPNPAPEPPAAEVRSPVDAPAEEDELLPGGPPAEAAP
jgi:23S rRNA (guanosine2251-2'-O)-methyltransferase